MLKPTDLYVVLKLAVTGPGQTYQVLAASLALSASQVHRSVRSAQRSGLVDTSKHAVDQQALLDLLVHGARYVYPAQRAAITRGVPTAHAAPPMNTLVTSGGPPLVWPSPSGTVRGEALQPLHKNAPEAAGRDSLFYEVLALVDALRVGRARERRMAEELLRQRLSMTPLERSTRDHEWLG